MNGGLRCKDNDNRRQTTSDRARPDRPYIMKFDKLIEGRNGWTKWQYPLMKTYRMACCDCGLVHSVQFGVIQQTTVETKKAGFRYRVIESPEMRVRMRAKRNNKQTRLLRKKDHITIEHPKPRRRSMPL